jgi:hypothetical protein
MTAEYDTLRDEGEAYVRKLIEASIWCRWYLGAVHGILHHAGQATPGAPCAE